MTNDRNITPAADRNREHGEGIDQVNELWDALATTLLGCLEGLAGGEEGDHLRLELIGPESESAAPDYYPYVQFASTGVWGLLQAEIPGNVLVHPLYRLDRHQCAALRSTGWFGNDPHGEIDWIVEFVQDDFEEIAHQAVVILRDYFGVVHPHLLTFRGSGLGDDIDQRLGLCASAKVPIDKPSLASFGTGGAGGTAETEARALVTSSHEELVVLVTEALAHIIDDEPEIDDEGDFLLHHMNQVVWVRVLEHQPGIQILARVVHDVRSRRGAAVELSILNRDTAWVTWSLHDRAIFQSILIPAIPFVPAHLEGLLKVFLRTMAATRDDLAFRTGGHVR